MSVVVVVSRDADPIPFLVWGRRFAAARGLGVEFLTLARSADTEGRADTSQLGEEVESRSLVDEDLFRAVQADVEAHNPELVVLARQAASAESKSDSRLAQKLFGALHCDTVMLRAGNGRAGECQSILVPASGGSHSLTALAWARDLASETDGGGVVPLFIEPDSGEVAAEVGSQRLEKILKRAGLKPESPEIDPRVEVADDVREGIARVVAEGEHDLVLIGASGVGILRSLLFGTIPERLFKGDSPMAVAVVRSATTLRERIQQRIERWLHLRIPQLDRPGRIALFENIETNARWSFDFMFLICLSTAIAGLGLILNSTAVVIGAMLVAPLMTPLIASGLAIVQGNLPLMRSAARAIVYGFFAALLIGMLLGFCVIRSDLTPEMEARGGPGLPDMFIALLSGVAASYCIARPNLSSALAGVAIAAALVPPIATVGIAISFGELGVAQGAAILFATNVVAIILGASLTFFATGVRAARSSGKRPVWVRRTLLGLVLCAMALSVPLGSVLITNLAQRFKDNPGQRTVYKVSEPVHVAMKEGVASLGDGSRLDGLSGYEVDGHRVIELEIAVRVVPDGEFAESLADRASEISGKRTRVRLLTRLVVESD